MDCRKTASTRSNSARSPFRSKENAGDSHLPRIVRRLRRTLAETQRGFSHDTLHLDSNAIGQLAATLVDFAEDLYNGVGIWEVYERYNREFFGTALSPTHQDLQQVADASSDFLSEAFAGVASDSGVKAFLRTPNTYGWDVKRKLVWLGTHSFMFRMPFARYMEGPTPGGSATTLSMGWRSLSGT